MRKYIVKQLLIGFVTICFVMVLNFVIMHLAPGDPIEILAGLEQPNTEQLDALRSRYGLDQPLYVQLYQYVATLLQGDLGTSYIYNQSVLSLIAGTLGNSLLLALTACILAFVIGTFLGLIAARKQGKPLDTALSYGSYLFDAMPPFWLGLIVIMLFSTTLHWFPTSGMTDLRAQNTGFDYVLDVLYHLVLPCGTLTVIQIPQYLRLTRSCVIQVMQEDYMTTLRASGMSEKHIFRRYVLKNAILPTLTIFGISLAYVVSGTVLVEIVFAWPGTGRLMLNAISTRDYPLLMGIYLMISVSVVVMTMVVDVLYALLDPRIRLK